MKIKLSQVFLASALITGCAGNEMYVPPGSESGSATLEFSGILNRTMSGAIFFTNGNNCTGNTRLPAKYDPFTGNAEPLPIPINQKVSVLRNYAYGYPMRVSCEMVISFTPALGEKYKSQFEATEKGCSGSIQVFDKAAQKWVSEPTSEKRQYNLPVFNDGPWCK